MNEIVKAIIVSCGMLATTAVALHGQAIAEATLQNLVNETYNPAYFQGNDPTSVEMQTTLRTINTSLAAR